MRFPLEEGKKLKQKTKQNMTEKKKTKTNKLTSLMRGKYRSILMVGNNSIQRF